MIRILTLALLLIIISGCSKPESRALQFDSTRICVPSDYVPGLSGFGMWLEENIEGLDSSEGSEIIRIPPEVIQKLVPTYKISHINKHNVDLRHEISGIAYRLSTIGAPNGSAKEAWGVYQNHESPLVVIQTNGMYRIYPWGNESFSWYLATSPPPKVAGLVMPNDWFVGYCGSTTDSCFQSVVYKDIWYQYHIQLTDLDVSLPVSRAIVSLFKKWESSCTK